MGDRYRAELPTHTVRPFVDSKPSNLFSKDNLRVDKRNANQFRPTFLQSGFINRVSGSGYAEFQNTKVLCTVIGPSPIASGQAFTEVGLVYCYFKYATFSRRDCRKGYQQDQEEKEYSVIMEDALANSICLEKYPKSRFDCHILILEDDGAALPIAITAASLAFADAGIEMFDIVTACSAAIVLNDNTNKDEVILDPSWEEQTRSKGIITFAYSSALAQVMHMHQTGYFTITQTAEAVQLLQDASSKLYEKVAECLLLKLNQE